MEIFEIDLESCFEALYKCACGRTFEDKSAFQAHSSKCKSGQKAFKDMVDKIFKRDTTFKQVDTKKR